MAPGLYLHIPFCQHRCSYCDFNTYTSLDELQGRYVEALCCEIEQVSDQQELQARTIYIGGGTPSLMKEEEIAKIIRIISSNFELVKGAEITLESNPESLDQQYLAAIHASGVNRLSIGAQSAEPKELAFLGRRHSFDLVIRRVQEARQVGFDNINIDLIYGLPGQELSVWERTLKAALALDPEHLSLYCLSIEPGTPLKDWLDVGRILEPDADLSADQYELACEQLSEHGYVHYEISNWSATGHVCQHNLIYWRNQSYLGFGAGAHGHAVGYRYQGVKLPRVYLRRLQNNWTGDFPFSAATAFKHSLSVLENMSDTVIMQLRLLEEGLDLDYFESRFGQSLYDAFPGVTEEMISWDLLYSDGRRLLLTDRGRFLSNQVFYRYL